MKRTLIAFLAFLGVAFAAPCHGDYSLNEAARITYQRVVSEATKRGMLVTSGPDYERIQRISQKLIAASPEMRPDAGNWAWDVSYIRTEKINALCMPGGKILVYSGLVENLSLTDDELAAILGHEMGHALLEHGQESYNERQVAKVVVGILGIVAAVVGAKHRVDPGLAFDATTGLGAVGAEFLALRPYNRERELAADKYGAELAARAGYDPDGAFGFHRKMVGKATTPEFLSTHPAPETRLQELQAVVPAMATQYASRRALSGVAVAVAVSTSPTISAAVPMSAVVTSQAASQSASGQMGSVASNVALTDSDPDAVVGAAATKMTSKYMFEGELFVKLQGCVAPASAMTVRAPTYEVFSMRCTDGREFVVRCTNGVCEPK